jgi:two-component system LytT family response regulator
MELTCMIIDDEPHARELLTDYIQKTPGLSLQGSYANPLEALQVFSGPNPPALAFLDVDMPELNGLELAGLVNGMTTVIFTTSHREYAPEAFEKNAADYLLKPIGYPRFLAAVNKASARLLVRESSEEPIGFFFLKTEVKGKLVRVNIPDIQYVESMGNYIQFYTAKEKIIAYLTLTEALEKLPREEFSRVHKSFAVAHHAIRVIEQGQLKLSDGTAIPIGRAYAESFMEAVRPFLLSSRRGT